MMNPFLLAGGMAIARQNLGRALHRTMLMFAAYGLLVAAGAVAIGFLTAAGFLQLTAAGGAVFASLAIAGVYTAIGMLGLFALMFMRSRKSRAYPILPVAGIADVAAPNGIPSGIAAVSLLVGVGCLLGRSMTRRRS